MTTIITNHFDISLNGKPLLNNRIEFIRHLALLRTQEFQKQCQEHNRTIRTPYQLWGGLPSVLLSQLLRTAIQGLEAYISSAVVLEAMKRGKLTAEIKDAAKNPSSLNRANTADNVFNGLPGLLDPQLALRISKKKLWKKLRAFYTDVRNPLFHGYELSNGDPLPVLATYEFLWNIYQWADEWHELPDLMNSSLKEIPEVKVLPPIPEAQKATFPGNRIREVIGWALLGRNLVAVSNVMEDGSRMNFEVTNKSGSALLAVLASSAATLAWPIDDLIAPGTKKP